MLTDASLSGSRRVLSHQTGASVPSPAPDGVRGNPGLKIEQKLQCYLPQQQQHQHKQQQHHQRSQDQLQDQEHNAPCKRRRVKELTEALLDSICRRVARSINAGRTPPEQLRERNTDLPKRSVLYSCCSESSEFFSSRDALGAAALDLTEPLFDDLDFCCNSTSPEERRCNAVSMNTSYNDTNSWDNTLHVSSSTSLRSIERSKCFSSDGLSNLNTWSLLASSESCSATTTSQDDESYCNSIKAKLLDIEPRQLPHTAFELFRSKILPICYLPEVDVPKILKQHWDRLPTSEKYAFEMQKFAHRDYYKNDMIRFLESLNEYERNVYLRLRKTEISKVFGIEMTNSSDALDFKTSTKNELDTSVNDALFDENNNELEFKLPIPGDTEGLFTSTHIPWMDDHVQRTKGNITPGTCVQSSVSQNRYSSSLHSVTSYYSLTRYRPSVDESLSEHSVTDSALDGTFVEHEGGSDADTSETSASTVSSVVLKKPAESSEYSETIVSSSEGF